ncbi:hypothetical protein [Cytobacillus horneckiae]|uniref:hypothetical protein n=1 Tax=Cytobacillus horneckiae TaxID=549687 RepID=UPI003D9A5447
MKCWEDQVAIEVDRDVLNLNKKICTKHKRRYGDRRVTAESPGLRKGIYYYTNERAQIKLNNEPQLNIELATALMCLV